MSRKGKYLQLSESDKLTLLEGANHHPKAAFREKCQALLLNHSGMSFRKIAAHMSVNHNTVGSWIKAWETEGLTGLTQRSGQGRKPILSTTNSTHKQLIARAIGIYSKNVKAIQAELIKELNTPLSSATVKRFLKKISIHDHPDRSDLSQTKPSKASIE